MSIKNKTFTPLSLAQYFDAPENYTGHFGWLCGYSADALFLDDATERFTRLTHSQRAHRGHIALAALLDPGNPAISLLNVPGLAHLPIKNYAQKPFRLLHAKVALLGFRHQENHSQWQLRLLVSTGNWTRQTLEESLDLVWRIDVTSESLDSRNTAITQDCADIKAAWDLLNWIRELFDTRLLEAPNQGRYSETLDGLQQVSNWINRCSKQAQGKPRFFDNRSKSLLSQLPESIKASGDNKRNYLAMGSGFYETLVDQEQPIVPLVILKTLHDENLLIGKPEVDLYVNPTACQAIATSLTPLRNAGITVRPAAIPVPVFGEGAHRSLHAKFLFSANSRDNSHKCQNAWVYLGSGNLTNPGFALKMSSSTGNLEAGVVFAPIALCWQESGATQDNMVVTNLLPIQWDQEIGEQSQLSSGSSMVYRDTLHVAPPIAWLKWYEVGNIRELRSSDNRVTEIVVLDSSGFACTKTETGFQWHEAQPREVCICWKTDDQPLEVRVPVVDQYGRIAATEMPAIEIEEVWWQLADFPMPPEDDEGDSEDNGIKAKDEKAARLPSTTSYPIRQMMDLLESIAAKQTEIYELDWALWCNRLEQTLGQAIDSSPVKYFRDELKLNPLSPLRHQSFRPSFADSSDSEAGRLYEDTLARIEKSWMVNELAPIEGAK